MTISITLTPDQERTLEELARQDGQGPFGLRQRRGDRVPERSQVEGGEDLRGNPDSIWEGWQRSGMTEDEVDDLFGQELQEVRRERHRQKGTA